MVPANWVHPMEDGRLKPLHDNYSEVAKGFMKMANEKGLQEAVDYYGRSPDKEDYMPEWGDEEKTPSCHSSGFWASDTSRNTRICCGYSRIIFPPLGLYRKWKRGFFMG